jgi:hypothetical protein
LSIGVALASPLACAGYSDALARGQRYYDDNQYERALALWRDLDRREATFAPVERARYAYFRGMTDYRLGFRDDARHWLSIARARDAEGQNALSGLWRKRLDGALVDLDRDTFGIVSDGKDVVQTIEVPLGTSLPLAPPADAGPGSAGEPGSER